MESLREHPDNLERLKEWKRRYKEATGVTPTEIPHTVVNCRVCNVPLWIPLSYTIRFAPAELWVKCPKHTILGT